MINKLMRMEERIVLDGSIVAAVSNNAAAENDISETQEPTDQPDALPLSDNDDLTDSDNTDTPIESNQTDNSDNDFLADNLDSIAEVIEASGGSAPDLRAIIINTDLINSEELINAVSEDIIIITYSAESDSLQDIIDRIDQASNGNYFDSIALAAHSNTGGEIFLLSDEHVSYNSLQTESDTDQITFFSQLGNLLNNDGRIDLLSCYSGLGAAGNKLISSIESISGKDVAASTDLTGNTSVNGDWILETGDIDAEELYFDSDRLALYSSSLQAPDQIINGSENLADRFGAHVAEDQGVMVVGSDDYASGFDMYTYTLDSDNDDVIDSWEYVRTFYLMDNGDSGTISSIFDLDVKKMNDNTYSFAVSLDATLDTIFKFDDITNASRGSGQYESISFLADSPNYNFGEDIELEGDILFSSKRSTDSNTRGIHFYYSDTDDYISYDNNGASALSLAAYYNSSTSRYSIVATGSEDTNLSAWSNFYIDGSTGNTVVDSAVDINANTNIVTNVDISGNMIIASDPTANSGEGTVFVYEGDNGVWEEDNLSLTATLSATTTGIGLKDIEISDDASTVFATANNALNILSWDITSVGDTPGVDTITSASVFEVLSGISSFSYSDDNSQLVAGSPDSSKDLSSVVETGVVNSFSLLDQGPIIWPALPDQEPADSNIAQTLIGGFSVEGAPDYIANFGSHVAADNGYMAVTSEDISDGIFIYNYQDTDSNGSPDTWVFTTKYIINDFTQLGGVNGIFSMDLDNDTLAVSLDGSDQDLIYVFRDIDNSSRSDTYYESEILGSCFSGTTFAEDIDVEGDAIFATDRSSSFSKIQLYWDNSGNFGNVTSGKYRTSSEYLTYNGCAGIVPIEISADQRNSNANAYTLAATSSTSSTIKVWAWDNGTTNMTTDGITLSFTPADFGGANSNPVTLKHVAVAEDYIIASAPSYSPIGNAGLGAIAVFRGEDGVWSNSELLNGKATLSAVLTGNPTVALSGNIGADGIAISDDGNDVFATSFAYVNSNPTYSILRWDLAGRIGSNEYTSIMTNDGIASPSDTTAEISSLVYTGIGSVAAGASSADKGVIDVSKSGVVDVFTNTVDTGGNDVSVSPGYTPGTPNDDPENPDKDHGTVVFNISEAVSLSAFSANMYIKIGHYNESNEFVIDAMLDSIEIASLLTVGNNTSISFDLNDSRFSDLCFGESYTVIVPSGMFADSTGSVNPEAYTYSFIIAEAIAQIPDIVLPHIPTFPDLTPGSSLPGSDGILNDNPLSNDVSSLLQSLLQNNDNLNLSDLNDNPDNDPNNPPAEGEGEGDNDQQQNTPAQVSRMNSLNPLNRGNSPVMSLSNFYASNIPNSSIASMFNNSLMTFSNLGSRLPQLGSLSQDAISGSMTTQALSLNAGTLLSQIDSLLVSLENSDSQDSPLSLSGGGHTATTISISSIIKNARDDLIEARGNALIANDLLRILSINLNGFDDKIAETSFSGGVQRLADSNEEFACCYEVLNSILDAINESEETGQPMTAQRLYSLLPDIEEASEAKASTLSDSSDRASRDVLILLTRQMQQEGVNQDTINDQVANVLSKWHDNLGLSEPIDLSSTSLSDIAHMGAEFDAVPAL